MKLTNALTGVAVNVPDELGERLLSNGSYQKASGTRAKSTTKSTSSTGAKGSKSSDANGAANDGSDTGSGAAADAG